jgi:hypothetical protein
MALCRRTADRSRLAGYGDTTARRFETRDFETKDIEKID